MFDRHRRGKMLSKTVLQIGTSERGRRANMAEIRLIWSRERMDTGLEK